jgi:hypothetical protein
MTASSARLAASREQRNHEQAPTINKKRCRTNNGILLRFDLNISFCRCKKDPQSQKKGSSIAQCFLYRPLLIGQQISFVDLTVELRFHKMTCEFQTTAWRTIWPQR